MIENRVLPAFADLSVSMALEMALDAAGSEEHLLGAFDDNTARNFFPNHPCARTALVITTPVRPARRGTRPVKLTTFVAIWVDNNVLA